MVARRVNCSAAQARAAWEQGWPEKAYAPAISKVYAEALRRLEHNRRIAQIAEDDRKLLATHREVISVEGAVDATFPNPETKIDKNNLTPAQLLQISQINAMQTEVDLLQTFRCNLIGAIAASAKLVPAFSALSASVAEHVLTAAQNPEVCTPDRLLGPLEKFAKIMTMLTASTKSVMEMQRLLVGAPMQITENRGTTDNTSAADYQERLQRASKVLDLAKRAGLMGDEPMQDGASYAGEETELTHSVMAQRDSELAPQDETPIDESQGPNQGQTEPQDDVKLAG